MSDLANRFIIFFGFICSKVFASSANIEPSGLNSRKESLAIIANGININPLARHDAIVWFDKGLDNNEVAVWANRRSIDLVALMGSLDDSKNKAGDQSSTVVLTNLVGYQKPLAEVIQNQLETQPKARYSQIIEDINKELLQEVDKDKKDLVIQQLASLQKIKDTEILWNSATIIVSYNELNKLAISRGKVKKV